MGSIMDQLTWNQSRTRRSPPAKLSTVRIEDGGDNRDIDSKERDRRIVDVEEAAVDSGRQE